MLSMSRTAVRMTVMRFDRIFPNADVISIALGLTHG